MESNQSFGNYEKQGGNANDDFEPGLYPAFIKSCRQAMDGNKPKENQDGKFMFDVVFLLDRNFELRRRFSISFGQNRSTSKWAAWAEFLQAATGVKCGDNGQRSLKPSDVEGQTVQVLVKRNDRGYLDITEVMSPGKKAAGREAWPKDNPYDPVVRTRTAAPSDDEINTALAKSSALPFGDAIDDEIPF